VQNTQNFNDYFDFMLVKSTCSTKPVYLKQERGEWGRLYNASCTFDIIKWTEHVASTGNMITAHVLVLCMQCLCFIITYMQYLKK
jgi:hypothetical protein